MAVHKRKYKSGKIVWRYAFNAPGSTEADRKQIVESGFATKKAATDAEAARRVAADAEYRLRKIQDVTAPLPETLGALLNEFLREHGEKRLAAKTLERYQQQAAMLDAELLKMPLGEVTALHLSREWNRLLQSGGRTRGTGVARPLSSKTVRNVAGVVSSAYARGVEWGIVQVNPVPRSKPPVIRRKQGVALTPAQQRLLIEAATSDWGLSTFLELDAATGARRGELLALRWTDIEGNVLSVTRSLSQTKAGLEFKETKSGRVNRITLPTSAVKALNAHRAAQKRLWQQFGPTYRTDLDLVFCAPDGSPLRPDSVSSAVSALCRRLKLPKGASLHTLRHTHGSHLLAAGVSLADVSRRLGHSNVYVTATVYAHAIAGKDDEAARRWEAFQQGSEQTAEKQ
jgi:integrase